MKITFFSSDKPRERLLAEAFAHGAMLHGHRTTIVPLTGDEQVATGDVACMVGVKSKRLFEANWKAGVHTLMFDKGYHRERMEGPIRTWEYWRMAYDGHHPTLKLEGMKCPQDRFDALGLRMQPWQQGGRKIIFAGGSEKYHEFYDLPEPTAYAQEIIEWINKHRGRFKLQDFEIVYRPKPTWRNAVPIAGTTYSTREDDITSVLKGAYALVTHGSNACFEAMLAGVPCIILGNAVAKPISSERLDDLRSPLRASDADRQQLLNNLAYCQWTMNEMYDGLQWDVLERWVYA